MVETTIEDLTAEQARELDRLKSSEIGDEEEREGAFGDNGEASGEGGSAADFGYGEKGEEVDGR